LTYGSRSFLLEEYSKYSARINAFQARKPILYSDEKAVAGVECEPDTPITT